MSRLLRRVWGSGAFGATHSPGFSPKTVSAALRLQRRALHLHEYQSMQLLRDFGAPTPRFAPARSPEEVREATEKLQLEQCDPSLSDVVVKAQVLAGGRGLGHFKENGFRGGVHVCKDAAAAAEAASQMIGFSLVTKQSGPEGKPCHVVLVCERLKVLKEMYLAVLLDRVSGGPVVIGRCVAGSERKRVACCVRQLFAEDS